jgi:enterochelin esterase-like enzyme
MTPARVAVGALVLAALVAIGVVAFFGGSIPTPVARDAWTSSDVLHSSLLGRDMPIEIFRPQSAATCARESVLYVFHGRGGDQNQWIGGGFGGAGADAVAHGLIANGTIRPVTIVSAYIGDTYGVDSAPASEGYTHGPYEQYILAELIPQVEVRLGLMRDRTERGVAGISMGGFVALSLSLRTDLFSRVAGLSPAIWIDPPRDREWIYGANGERNPVALAQSADLDGRRFFLGYGDRDYGWVSDAADELGTRLASRGASVSVLSVPGGHDVGTTRQLVEPMLTSLFPASDC